MRRLQVSVSGRWFLLLTIGLGVIALATGNNVLYLIESLLLSGLILSGVLSERAISAIQFEIHRTPATAKSPGHDRIKVVNTRKFPIFSVEIGEWGESGFAPISYIPKLMGRKSISLVSRQTFPRRGVHSWKGLAVATSAPFGFARKIRVLDAPGKRIIWPEKNGIQKTGQTQRMGEHAGRAGVDFADAEIRPFTHDDDYRLVVWTLSQKGMGPVVRVRRSEAENPEVVLDLRAAAAETDEQFEARVRNAAQPFYQLGDSLQGGTLTVVHLAGRTRFHGRAQALNHLALARKDGKQESA